MSSWLKSEWLSLTCLLGLLGGAEATHNRIGLVRDAQVVLRDGNEFGKIYDFILTDRGCIDYVVVAYENRYYVVPYSVVRINFSDRSVRLITTRTRLDRLSFEGDNWPNFRGSAFSGRLRSAFGVSSGRAKVHLDEKDRRGRANRSPKEMGEEAEKKDSDKQHGDRKKDQKESTDSDPKPKKDPPRDAEKKQPPDKERPPAQNKPKVEPRKEKPVTPNEPRPNRK